MQPLKNCIGPTIHIGQEILCLPYAEFSIVNHAKKSLIIFREYNLTKKYLPAMDSLNPIFERFVFKALDNCDQRIANNKHISPGFIFSVFLWQDVFELWKKT